MKWNAWANTSPYPIMPPPIMPTLTREFGQICGPVAHEGVIAIKELVVAGAASLRDMFRRCVRKSKELSNCCGTGMTPE